MFTLRFQRQGKKKDFIYRIVAIDSRFSVRSGKVKENLGWWNPKTDKFNLNKERISYWLKQGAKPTDSCHNLLVKAKIISGPKRKITIKKKEEKSNEEKQMQRSESTNKSIEEPKEEPKEIEESQTEKTTQ